MYSKLNREQLAKLVLYTSEINHILLDAMFSLLPEQEKREVELEIHVVEMDGNRDNEVEPENLDVLCGEWKSAGKKPAMLIFKAAPGYMIVLGKKPKKHEAEECYLIRNMDGNLCFNTGKGIVYLAYDEYKDTISLYPGGGYTRMDEPQK